MTSGGVSAGLRQARVPGTAEFRVVTGKTLAVLSALRISLLEPGRLSVLSEASLDSLADPDPDVSVSVQYYALYLHTSLQLCKHVGPK